MVTSLPPSLEKWSYAYGAGRRHSDLNPPLGKCAKRANAIPYAREQGRLDNGDVFAAEFGKMVVCIWSRQAASHRSEASYSATDQTVSPSVSEGCYKPTTKGWC